MKVGLTYDLRDDYILEGFTEEETAEMDSISTIESLEETIISLGYEVERIGNIKSFVNRIAAKESWDLIFNIAEGIYGLGREAQVPALADAYRIPYTFSDTIVLAVSLQKALTKRIVSDLGIATPDFYSVRSKEAISNVRLPYPLFAKPVAEGTGRGITNKSIINNPKELREVCLNLLETYHQPVLVERYLSGREFTVGIIGTGNNAEVAGVMEIVVNPSFDENVYGFKAKELCEKFVEYKTVSSSIAEEAGKMALTIHRGINCRDASRVDLKCNEKGELEFLEINPLAGLNPSHSDLPILCTLSGIKYQDLINRIIESAKERIKK